MDYNEITKVLSWTRPACMINLMKRYERITNGRSNGMGFHSRKVSVHESISSSELCRFNPKKRILLRGLNLVREISYGSNDARLDCIYD